MNSKTYNSVMMFQGKTAEEIRQMCEEAVSRPGRLEGEGRATAYFHAVSEETGDICFDVTAEDIEIMPELAGVAAVEVYWDSFGFCYMSKHESLDAAEQSAQDAYEAGFNE